MSYESRIKDPFIDKLFQAILLLQNEEECYRLFEDLTTVSEIQAMAQRLEVAKMLDKNYTYTYIADSTGASTATISRVKRCLHYGSDGYRLILDKLKENDLFEE